MIRISASQIETWRRCGRYYYLTYIKGLRSPHTAATKWGGDYHEQVEKHLKGEEYEVFDPYTWAKLLPLLPKNATAEQEITFPLSEGVEFLGYIDIIDEEKEELLDLKTRSNLRWMKPEQALQFDVQMICYAYWALHYKWTHRDRITIKHLNVERVGNPGQARRVVTVSVTLDRFHVDQQFALIRKQDIDAMVAFRKEYAHQTEKFEWETDTRGKFPSGHPVAQAAHKINGQNDAPYHGACRKYGGCPYTSLCDNKPVLDKGDYWGVNETETTETETKPEENNVSEALNKFKEVYSRLDGYDQANVLVKFKVRHIDDISPEHAMLEHAVREGSKLLSWPDQPTYIEASTFINLTRSIATPTVVVDEYVKAVRDPMRRSAIMEEIKTDLSNHLRATDRHSPDVATTDDPAIWIAAMGADPTPPPTKVAPPAPSIAPPDMPEEKKPSKTDGLPITEIDTIGEKLEEFMAEVMEIETPITTIQVQAYLNENTEKAFVKSVKGLSQTKMDLIKERFPEKTTEEPKIAPLAEQKQEEPQKQPTKEAKIAPLSVIKAVQEEQGFTESKAAHPMAGKLEARVRRVLYIDCIPNVPHVSLDDILAKYAKEASDEIGEYWLTASYNEGVKLTQSKILRAFSPADIGAEHVVASSYSALYRDIINPVAGKFDLVVRGIK